MLLLSSATKILATERPPTILYARGPHLARGHTKWPLPMQWSIRLLARQCQRGKCVSEVNTMVWPIPWLPKQPKTQRARLPSAAPLGFLLFFALLSNSPGNEFFQAFLFFAGGFLRVGIGCPVGCGLRRGAVRLGSCLRRSRRAGTIRGTLRRWWSVRIRWRDRFFFGSFRCWSYILRPTRCCARPSGCYIPDESRARTSDSRLVPALQHIDSCFVLSLRRHRRLSALGGRTQLLVGPGLNKPQRLLDQ